MTELEYIKQPDFIKYFNNEVNMGILSMRKKHPNYEFSHVTYDLVDNEFYNNEYKLHIHFKLKEWKK